MDDLRDKYIGLIAGAADEAALEDLRVQAVGKKGEVALKMRELGKMSPEERQVAGPALNALKDEINSALGAKKVALADAALDERLRTEWLDVTLPTRPSPAVPPRVRVWVLRHLVRKLRPFLNEDGIVVRLCVQVLAPLRLTARRWLAVLPCCACVHACMHKLRE